jgi:diguanylate cyclase (GGDEF)-like protein
MTTQLPPLLVQQLLKLANAQTIEQLHCDTINALGELFSNCEAAIYSLNGSEQKASSKPLVKTPGFESGNGYKESISAQQFALFNTPGTAYAELRVQHLTPADIEATQALAAMTSHIYQHICRSSYDTLTGLLNRQAFEEHMQRIYNSSSSANRRNGDNKPCVLAIMDIDFFKQVNDTYGHQLGDEVLLIAAQTINKTIRDSDCAYRFGGEEFVVILENCSIQQADTALLRLWQVFNQTRFPQVGKLGISIGYCELDTQLGYDTNIERADAALYFAKQNGRNQACNYERLVRNSQISAIEDRSGDIELF